MSKVRAYIRVAKSGYKYRIDASAKENIAPIIKKGGYNKADEFLPTIAFAVDLDIADELFSSATRLVATINVSEKNAVVAAEVPVPAKSK